MTHPGTCCSSHPRQSVPATHHHIRDSKAEQHERTKMEHTSGSLSCLQTHCTAQVALMQHACPLCRHADPLLYLDLLEVKRGVPKSLNRKPRPNASTGEFLDGICAGSRCMVATLMSCHVTKNTLPIFQHIPKNTSLILQRIPKKSLVYLTAEAN